MNTRPLRRLIATCGLALLFTGPAVAQEPGPDPLEAGAAPHHADKRASSAAPRPPFIAAAK